MAKYEKNYWLNEESRKFLSRDYLLPGQTPEERIREIAYAAEKILGIPGYAEKLIEYIELGYIALSTPVWLNFGNDRGLPISCFNSHISDSVEAILSKAAEVGYMTKNAGGTSGYFGDIRARGQVFGKKGEGITEGPVRFMELYDKVTSVISQGSARRGHFAAYLPIDHADIEEFLQIRETGNTIQEMSIGVCISDAWMQSMVDGDKAKRVLWGKIIKKRVESGYPYLFFTDTANELAPKWYREQGYKINSSNMCTEIFLPSTADESFVCDLAPMNLLHFDAWKHTDAVKVAIYLLDAVMTEFINKTEHMPLMAAPRRFAIRHRALGLGGMGWHSYLKSKMIPFESLEAMSLNNTIWKFIHDQAEEATLELGKMFGPCEVCAPYDGRRNATTMAIAPNTSSSTIHGQVSPGIEMDADNYFVKILAKGNITYRCQQFAKFLREKGYDTPEIWKSVLDNGGSVQHLDILTDHEKAVFKTFGETSQKVIVDQAAQRQRWIDQGQSLNTMGGPDTPPKELSQLYIYAWQTKKIKAMYYHRGGNPAQQLAREINKCVSCES